MNWIPAWALGGSDGDDCFRVVSGGRVIRAGLRNWYADRDVARAQALLAGEGKAVTDANRHGGDKLEFGGPLVNQGGYGAGPTSRSSRAGSRPDRYIPGDSR